jgi:hypothetical protein
MRLRKLDRHLVEIGRAPAIRLVRELTAVVHVTGI